MEFIIAGLTAVVYRIVLKATKSAPAGSMGARLNVIMGGGGPGPVDETPPQ